jgi:hypothetical protein
MRILLKIITAGLLLLLVLALGTEVAALHRGALAPVSLSAHPVVVRKALNSAEHPKTVHPAIK